MTNAGWDQGCAIGARVEGSLQCAAHDQPLHDCAVEAVEAGGDWQTFTDTVTARGRS